MTIVSIGRTFRAFGSFLEILRSTRRCDRCNYAWSVPRRSVLGSQEVNDVSKQAAIYRFKIFQ